ncbi:MAG: hypothetical protein M3328_09145, partial [Chloroflexota bacterium]|nr:hypothetical protein [Chloroflexota bacterium]
PVRPPHSTGHHEPWFAMGRLSDRPLYRVRLRNPADPRPQLWSWQDTTSEAETFALVQTLRQAG